MVSRLVAAWMHMLHSVKMHTAHHHQPAGFDPGMPMPQNFCFSFRRPCVSCVLASSAKAHAVGARRVVGLSCSGSSASKRQRILRGDRRLPAPLSIPKGGLGRHHRSTDEQGQRQMVRHVRGSLGCGGGGWRSEWSVVSTTRPVRALHGCSAWYSRGVPGSVDIVPVALYGISVVHRGRARY